MAKRNGKRRAWTSEHVRALKALARKKTPAAKIARATRSIRYHQILTRLPCATALWIAVAVVQTLDVMTVEALISHPHPGTKRVNGGKIFDGEANCLCRRGKATKTDWLTQTGFAVFWYEQFGRCGVIERHHFGLSETMQE